MALVKWVNHGWMIGLYNRSGEMVCRARKFDDTCELPKWHVYILDDGEESFCFVYAKTAEEAMYRITALLYDKCLAKELLYRKKREDLPSLDSLKQIMYGGASVMRRTARDGHN